MTESILDQTFPQQQEIMRESMRFMKELATNTNPRTEWSIAANRYETEPPVFRTWVYRNDTIAEQVVADITIELEPDNINEHSDYRRFIDYRQAQFADAIAMLRLFATANTQPDAKGV